MRPLLAPRAVVGAVDVRIDRRLKLQEGMMDASLGHHPLVAGQPFPTDKKPLPLVSSTKAPR